MAEIKVRAIYPHGWSRPGVQCNCNRVGRGPVPAVLAGDGTLAGDKVWRCFICWGPLTPVLPEGGQ